MKNIKLCNVLGNYVETRVFEAFHFIKKKNFNYFYFKAYRYIYKYKYKKKTITIIF